MAADALGILGFSLHAIHKAYDIFESIKDAPEDIQVLKSEAGRVKNFIPQLLDALQDGMINPVAARSNTQLQELLQDIQKLTDESDKFLCRVTKKRQDDAVAVKKIKWIFNAAECTDLTTRYKNFYLSLCTVYTIMTS